MAAMALNSTPIAIRPTTDADDECSICFHKFRVGEEQFTHQNGNHVGFHRQCFRKWLLTDTNETRSCPMVDATNIDINGLTTRTERVMERLQSSLVDAACAGAIGAAAGMAGAAAGGAGPLAAVAVVGAGSYLLGRIGVRAEARENIGLGVVGSGFISMVGKMLGVIPATAQVTVPVMALLGSVIAGTASWFRR